MPDLQKVLGKYLTLFKFIYYNFIEREIFRNIPNFIILYFFFRFVSASIAKHFIIILRTTGELTMTNLERKVC